MDDANLFQLGISLETGAHEEDSQANIIAKTIDPNSLNVVMDENCADHFIHRDGKIYAGTHLIIEVCDGTGLDDEVKIQQAFKDCVEQCGATLLHIHTHKFSPQGVSGVAVLAESHISVHTWPEIGYGAFDVFMCGDANPWAAVDVLSKAFNTQDIRTKEILRGEGLIKQS